jgi:Domain of Unknown Function with PDB structure (DUF3857)
MKKNLLIVLVVLLSFAAFAQQIKEPKSKFGKVSDEEMNMKSYSADPNAAAVILFDKGLVSYTYDNQYGWVQLFEVHKRIKIFKKEAYDYANVSFPYWSKAKIDGLKGITYNLEGGKIVETKLESDNIFNEELSKNRSVKKFNFPAVKEGSIIEYKYTIRSENAVGIPDWYFQDLIPTVWSEFETIIPDFIDYHKMSQGYTPFHITEEKQSVSSFNVVYRSETDLKTSNSTVENINVSYNKNTMHFVQANVPALKKEAYTNSPYDYLSRILFEIKNIYNVGFQLVGSNYTMYRKGVQNTYNSWEDLGKEIYTDVYDEYMSSKKNLDENTLQSMNSATSTKEKVEILMKFFNQNFTTSSILHKK